MHPEIYSHLANLVDGPEQVKLMAWLQSRLCHRISKGKTVCSFSLYRGGRQDHLCAVLTIYLSFGNAGFTNKPLAILQCQDRKPVVCHSSHQECLERRRKSDVELFLLHIS
jgi:hypothetical protein